MNYKAYEPNPHSTLAQIKTLLEKEEFYQAWIICSQYFMGLETNDHIRRALGYAARDNVYKYVLEHMHGKHDTKPANNGLEIYQQAAENLDNQGKSYAVAKTVMEQFCAANGMDLNAMVEEFEQKNKKLSREELIEKNKGVAERQAGKFAKAADVTPVPIGEEAYKLAEEAAKFNENLNLQLIDRILDTE